MNTPYKHVALIGLGLISSSIAHALRRAGYQGRITGSARSAENRAKTEEIGFCDAVFESNAEAAKGADLVILCVPVGAMGPVTAEISEVLSEGTTVTDVGSVKAQVIQSVLPHIPKGVHFVAGHPVAGSELSGPEAGYAELFDARWVLLTPLPGVPDDVVANLTRFWQDLGAKVDRMDPSHHDLVLAATSHAPHLIAYTMVGVADDLSRVTETEVVNFSAAGFRDFTRIAASDPTMWRDVFLSNREATLEILGRFTEELFALQRAIRTGDGAHLHDYFTRTRAIRQAIVEAGQDIDDPDFGRIKAKKESSK